MTGRAHEPIRPLLVYIVVLAAAAMFLFPCLDMKPVHHDEAVNGWFVAKMWERGCFKYDPSNYHGPLFFYLLQLSEIVFGFGIFGMRLVCVLFTLGTVCLVLKHDRWFGSAAWWAGALLAVSPALTFYSRYAIHEAVFVFFQAMFSYGFFRHWFIGGRKSVVLITAGVAGMLLTKETWIVFIVTWGIAWTLATVYGKKLGEEDELFASSLREKVGFSETARIVMIGAGALFLVYSGFCLNPNGVVDFFKSLAFWTKTGIDSAGHEKPFHYWLELMFRYETAVLPSIFCFAVLIIRFPRSARFWGAFAFGTFLAYSIIPYKTPWCILNIVWPCAFVIGILLRRTLSLKPDDGKGKVLRVLPVMLVALLIVKSVYSSFLLSFINYESSDESYNYVQTRNSLKNVASYIETATAGNPAWRNMKLNVFLKGPWPLPWLLTRYPDVKWNFTENPDADVVLIETRDRRKTEALLSGKYLVLKFEVREARQPVIGYFAFDKFDGVIGEFDEIFRGGKMKATGG